MTATWHLSPRDYDVIAEEGDGAALGIKRSTDDMMFVYTGGTTGMPKGVMWRHGDLSDLWHNAAAPHDGRRRSGFDGRSSRPC